MFPDSFLIEEELGSSRALWEEIARCSCNPAKDWLTCSSFQDKQRHDLLHKESDNDSGPIGGRMSYEPAGETALTMEYPYGYVKRYKECLGKSIDQRKRWRGPHSLFPSIKYKVLGELDKRFLTEGNGNPNAEPRIMPKSTNHPIARRAR